MSTHPRLVEVRQHVLKRNDEVARALRVRFHEAGSYVVSLVSSPGSGKTAFLERVLTSLRDRYRVAALVGDLATDNDAQRLARAAVPVKQIITGSVCHLEAAMIATALDDWRLDEPDFLFVENVGNLVCPSSFDLGEDLRLVLFSVSCLPWGHFAALFSLAWWRMPVACDRLASPPNLVARPFLFLEDHTMIAVRLLALTGAVTLLLGMLSSHARAADDAKTGFLNRVYKDADGKEAKYVLFVPHDYKGDKEYPVILFLHGAGETGTDGVKQARVGLGPAIKKHEKNFPFIAVFPQSQKRTWRAGSDDAKRALAILAVVEKEYKVDAKRVYLTGLSMGGFGTWSLAVAQPDKWAAIVPICGGGDPSKAEKIKELPCWCFHGDKDPAVKVEASRKMIEALKKAGGEPKYTEYPGVGHNSWDKAYGTKELYEWLLQQHKK